VYLEELTDNGIGCLKGSSVNRTSSQVPVRLQEIS